MPRSVAGVTRKYLRLVDVAPRRTPRGSRGWSGPAARAPPSLSETSSTVTSSPCAVLADPAQVRLGRGPAVDVLLRAARRCRRRSPCRARRTSACRRPGRPPSCGTSRVTTRSTSRVASLPVTRYLKSGETSISAAALRIALYSRSWCDLVAADGEVAGPVAPAHALAERRGARVERGSDRHVARARMHLGPAVL